MQFTLLDIKDAVGPAPELAELDQIAAGVDLTSRDLVSLADMIADTFDETLSVDLRQGTERLHSSAGSCSEHA